MHDLQLRSIESSVWRGNQQDGLFDLFFATLFVGIALSQLADGLWGREAVTLAVLVGIQACAAAGFAWARRRITRPRLGVVRFARRRKRRAQTMVLVLALCVAATLALVLLTALSRRGAGPVSRLAVSAVAGALILIPLAAIAYFQEFPRVLVHAALFLAAEFGGTALEQATATPFPRAITFGAAALVSGTIGALLLRRFLRNKPEELPAPGSAGTDDA